MKDGRLTSSFAMIKNSTYVSVGLMIVLPIALDSLKSYGATFPRDSVMALIVLPVVSALGYGVLRTLQVNNERTNAARIAEAQSQTTSTAAPEVPTASVVPVDVEPLPSFESPAENLPSRAKNIVADAVAEQIAGRMGLTRQTIQEIARDLAKSTGG